MGESAPRSGLTVEAVAPPLRKAEVVGSILSLSTA